MKEKKRKKLLKLSFWTFNWILRTKKLIQSWIYLYKVFLNKKFLSQKLNLFIIFCVWIDRFIITSMIDNTIRYEIYIYKYIINDDILQTKCHLALMRINCDDKWALTLPTDVELSATGSASGKNNGGIAPRRNNTNNTNQRERLFVSLFSFLKHLKLPVYYNASIRLRHSMQTRRCLPSNLTNLAPVFASCETDGINSCSISGPMA